MDNTTQDYRKKEGLNVGFFGLCSNIFLFIAKITIGLIANSITTITDAINNLSDTGNSLLMIFSFKTSGKPATSKHPYGYARFEYVGGLFISIFILFIGILLCKTSIEKILKPETISISWILYVVLVLSILVKILMQIYYISKNKKLKSLAIKGLIQDSKFDSIGTSIVLISIIIYNIWGINLEGYFGVILALIIIYSSVKLILEIVSPLIGERAQEQFIFDIKTRLNDYSIVLGIHDIMVHSYGTNKNFVVAHILVDSTIPVMEIYDEVSQIEREFGERYDIHLTLHVDPVEINDIEEKEMKNRINNLLSKKYDNLTITNFRIVHQKHKDIIILEIVVPFDLTLKKSEVQAYLSKNILGKRKYQFIIDFDKPYTPTMHNTKKF